MAIFSVLLTPMGKITNWVSANGDIFLCVLSLLGQHVAVHYDTHEHLFNQVRVLNKQKLRSAVGILLPQVYPVSFVVVLRRSMPLFKMSRSCLVTSSSRLRRRI